MSDALEQGGNGFVEIEEAECKRLLRGYGIGILGTLVAGELELRPVNYLVYRGSVIVRTDRGMLFEAASREQSATLAVVSFDADTRTAWSVVAKGQLGHADAHVSGVQLFSWAHEGKAERIRLTLDSLSGRRLEARLRDD